MNWLNLRGEKFEHAISINISLSRDEVLNRVLAVERAIASAQPVTRVDTDRNS